MVRGQSGALQPDAGFMAAAFQTNSRGFRQRLAACGGESGHACGQRRETQVVVWLGGLLMLLGSRRRFSRLRPLRLCLFCGAVFGLFRFAHKVIVMWSYGDRELR